MHHYIQRDATGRIIHRLQEMPAVALLGARQCGKSTLADFLLETIPQSIYLVLEKGDFRLAVECKASSAPGVSRSFYTAIQDIDAAHAFVVAPVEDRYPIAENIEVTSLEKCLIECHRRGFLV